MADDERPDGEEHLGGVDDPDWVDQIVARALAKAEESVQAKAAAATGEMKPGEKSRPIAELAAEAASARRNQTPARRPSPAPTPSARPAATAPPPAAPLNTPAAPLRTDRAAQPSAPAAAPHRGAAPAQAAAPPPAAPPKTDTPPPATAPPKADTPPPVTAPPEPVRPGSAEPAGTDSASPDTLSDAGGPRVATLTDVPDIDVAPVDMSGPSVFDDLVGAADEPTLDGATRPDDGDGEGGDANRMRSILEWGAVIVGALVVAFLIKTFLLQAFFIPSGSMEPTLNVGDRVLVNKLAYDFHDVRRGDLIVFDRPEAETGGVPDLIKRVIALPGETIEFRDGVIYIDNRRLEEPYLPPGFQTSGLSLTNAGAGLCGGTAMCQVPEGYVFVMGDNRNDSRDSRFFGPVEEDGIVGRAFLRVWPISNLDFL